MIDSVSNLVGQQLFKPNQMQPGKIGNPEFPGQIDGLSKPNETKSFDSIVGKFVGEVEAKRQASVVETNKMLLGETDNVHQSMIAMQESGLAFSMMVEVRNKLVQSYQELMKMPV